MHIKDFTKRILPNSVVEFIQHLNTIKTIKKTHKNYEKVVSNLQNEIKNRPIRFASYVVFDSAFGAKKLYELMKNDDKFDAKIVIIPDTARGEENLKKCYNATKEFFIKNYGKEMVLDGWDEKTGEFLDHSDKFDIIYCANPYDDMVHKLHKISYLSKKNVLPVYIPYAFYPFEYCNKEIAPLFSMSLFWKIFLDSKITFEEFKKFEIIKAKNAIVTGYAKMDDFINLNKINNSKKSIIIAPHHTIKNGSALQISNFLYYYDFILELPNIFPNINFIFRPHPLLFVNLVNYGFWSELEVDNYIEKIKKSMTYSVGGDYLKIFANADGIVHDCSSFIAEWLFSGKKGCFVSFDSKVFSQLSKFGKKALSFYDIAKNKEDIISYITSIENDKIDNLNLENMEDIIVNYPNASKKILDEIKTTLKLV